MKNSKIRSEDRGTNLAKAVSDRSRVGAFLFSAEGLSAEKVVKNRSSRLADLVLEANKRTTSFYESLELSY